MQCSTIAILGAAAFLLLTVPPAESTNECWDGSYRQGCSSHHVACLTRNDRSDGCGGVHECPNGLQSCGHSGSDEEVCCCLGDLCNRGGGVPQPGPLVIRGPDATTGIRCHVKTVHHGDNPPKVEHCPLSSACFKGRGDSGKSEYNCGCLGGSIDACIDVKLDGHKAEVCCCNTNECNHAVTGVRPPPFALIVVGALLLIGAYPILINH